jgi:hypothetical protein
VSRDRLLVIDADISKRVATHLMARRRNAVSAAELHLADNVTDPQLLRALAGNYNGVREWVLVTGDDAMPAEHGDVILETRATIATIHPEYPRDEMTEYHWRVDVVHRWAHAMQLQAAQTVRRYSLMGSQVWRPRRRHMRQIALHGWTPWRPENAEAAGSQRPGTRPSTPMGNPAQRRLPGLE